MKTYKIGYQSALWLTVLLLNLGGFASESWAEGLYNAREDLEYGRYATMARRDEQLQQKQFVQYQQQQYLQQQRLFDRQYLYNQTHIKGNQDYSTEYWENGIVRK